MIGKLKNVPLDLKKLSDIVNIQHTKDKIK